MDKKRFSMEGDTQETGNAKREYLEKAAEAIEAEKEKGFDAGVILEQIKINMNIIEGLGYELAALEDEYQEKFKSIPETDEQWKEEKELKDKIREKEEEMEKLQKEIDSLFGELDKIDLEKDIEEELKTLRKNISAKYPREN